MNPVMTIQCEQQIDRLIRDICGNLIGVHCAAERPIDNPAATRGCHCCIDLLEERHRFATDRVVGRKVTD